MPPKCRPGLTTSLSKKEYRCNACTSTPRGTDLSRHYKRNTNFRMLKELKECVGDEKLEILKSDADKHTLYMFQWGHSEDNLPHWKNHAMVKLKQGNNSMSMSSLRARESEDEFSQEEDQRTGTGLPASVLDTGGSSAKRQRTIKDWFSVSVISLSLI